MQVQFEGRNKTRTGSSNIATLPRMYAGFHPVGEVGGKCMFLVQRYI